MTDQHDDDRRWLATTFANVAAAAAVMLPVILGLDSLAHDTAPHPLILLPVVGASIILLAFAVGVTIAAREPEPTPVDEP